jgi:hypothetical protein
MIQEAGWAEAGCAVGPVWTGAGNFTPMEFDPRAFQHVASRYRRVRNPGRQAYGYCSGIIINFHGAPTPVGLDLLQRSL